MNSIQDSLTGTNIKYLLAVYWLGNGINPVKSIELADNLSVTKPSVHIMLKTLSRLGLIEKNHYGKINLTDIGIQTAEKYDYYYSIILNNFSKFINDSNELRDAICAFISHIPQQE